MKFFLFCTVLILGFGLFGADAFAQLRYEPIVEIPRLDPNTQSTEQYVNALYLLAITVAAFLAVVKIIFGGVKWMLSDVVTDKSAAKKDIRGALLGLLIVLAAVIILNTINEDLTNLNILGDATGIGDTSGDTDDEDELPPLVNTEIGDRMNLSDAEDGEAAHFADTCPGVVNTVRGGNGDTYLHCDEEVDEVAQIQLSCTGGTCTCDYGASNNRGLCMARCQTAGPAGYELAGTTDISSTVLQCNYNEVRDPSECADTPQWQCLTNTIGGPACDSDDIPPAEQICRQSVSGATTYFYGFAE